MKHFKAKTYVPYNFPILDTGQELDVYLKEEKEWIGIVKVLGISENQYSFEFFLDQEVNRDLYATVSQSASNGRTTSQAHVTLSKDEVYGRFIQTIGSQQP